MYKKNPLANLVCKPLQRWVILFILILNTFSVNTFCQSITGKVLDASGKPLPFANILLLSSKDSSLVKGAVSDTLGIYSIDNIREGKYLVSARMIGYKQENLMPLSISSSSSREIEIATLKLNEDVSQLNEVVVVEKRPFVEQHLDKMVVNVSNSIIASGSTALEILEKAPGVTVDRQSDQIQLRGKDGVIVQLDGKQTYLSMNDVVALLRSMSSDNIDQIELITNPSAKYDAAGNSGIINIRMKKNNAVGTNGSITLGGGSGRYHRARGSVQLNHRTKKFNFFLNYSGTDGGNYFNLVTQQIRREEEYSTFSDQETYIHMRTRGQNAKSGIDFFISKNTTLGIIWTGFWNNHQEDGTAESAFQREVSGPLFLHAKTDKTISSFASNQIGNINLQHKFNDKGGQLTLDFDKGQFTRDFLNTLYTQTLISENEAYPFTGLINEMPTEIKITTVKVDYNRSLFARAKIEMGFKYSYVWNDNDLTISQGEERNLEVDPELSNHFLYKERVTAGYVSVTGKLGAKTDIQLGLRAEHTRSIGNSISFNNIVTRDYLNLFPSLFLSAPLSPKHTLGLSYSYRIDRPNYQNLNPARSYVDPYFYSQGNAYLTPQYTHSVELKHGFKEHIFTSVGSSYTDDLIFQVVQPVDSVRNERTPLNIGQSQAYNLTLTFPLQVMKGWNIQTTLQGTYNYFHYTYRKSIYKVEQISARINASNSIVFGKGWTGEITGWLRTPTVYAFNRSPWQGSVDVGIQKLLGARLKANLSAQDVFHSNKFIRSLDTPTFYQRGDLAFDTRIIMLSFTYTFGNNQLKGIRQRKTGSEEETQRSN